MLRRIPAAILCSSSTATAAVEDRGRRRLARVDRWVDVKGYGFATELPQSPHERSGANRSVPIFIHRSELCDGRRRLEEGQIVSVVPPTEAHSKQRVVVEHASPLEWSMERSLNTVNKSSYAHRGSDRVALSDVDFDFTTEYDNSEMLFVLHEHTAVFR